MPAPTPAPARALDRGQARGWAEIPADTPTVLLPRPSPYSRHSYEFVGFRLRAAFHNAIRAGALEAAAEIVGRMRRETGDLIWCANAARRLHYHQARR